MQAITLLQLDLLRIGIPVQGGIMWILIGIQENRSRSRKFIPGRRIGNQFPDILPDQAAYGFNPYSLSAEFNLMETALL